MHAAFQKVAVQSGTEDLVGHCNAVIKAFQARGHKLTLRQLYYQLVTKNLIENTPQSYKRLGKAVSTGRLTGEIDWDAIEDRVRVPKKHPEWGNLHSLVESAIYSYRLPRLKGQPTYVELWVEKDALAGVLEPITRRFHVVLMVNRGYSSQSAMYEAACRIDRACRRIEYNFTDHGEVIRPAVVLYLGDFDPSGEDMVRDIQDRLTMFLAGYVPDPAEYESKDEFELADRESPGMNSDLSDDDPVDLQVIKIGITKPQIKQYNPPPNPAKRTDSRSKAFIAEHGASSWEVDALPPEVLEQIVTYEIESRLDMDMMNEIIERENEHKQALRELADQMK